MREDEFLSEPEAPRISSDRCPQCLKIIKKPSSEHFESPDYVFHQLATLIEELKKDKLKPDEDTFQLKEEGLRRAAEHWFRTCLHEDRIAALTDAMQVMKHLIYTRSSTGEIRQLIKLAKNIGEVATALESVIKVGVPTYDREVRQVCAVSRDADGSSSSATASGDT
jgi:hypothetical protein